jgi:hypothetical protein
LAFEKISLANIQKLAGGTIDESFQRHLRRAIADCGDRPGDGKARTVSLVLQIRPETEQMGAASHVSIECKLKSSVPDHVSRPISCKINQKSDAIFNDLAPDNVRQTTIDQQ